MKNAKIEFINSLTSERERKNKKFISVTKEKNENILDQVDILINKYSKIQTRSESEEWLKDNNRENIHIKLASIFSHNNKSKNNKFFSTELSSIPSDNKVESEIFEKRRRFKNSSTVNEKNKKIYESSQIYRAVIPEETFLYSPSHNIKVIKLNKKIKNIDRNKSLPKLNIKEISSDILPALNEKIKTNSNINNYSQISHLPLRKKYELISNLNIYDKIYIGN
jgi:hypothetical protein